MSGEMSLRYVVQDPVRTPHAMLGEHETVMVETEDMDYENAGLARSL